jgi:hypothetical protein
MFGRIIRYWRGISLATLFNLPSLWEGIKWLWDWFGRFDVATNYLRDLWGFKPMIGFLTNPPPWTVFPSVLFGVLVILWDARRQDKKVANGPVVYDLNRRLLIGFYAGCAAVVVGVWSAWWVISTPAKAIPAPVAPAPAPVVTSQPSPPPRTTEATSERAIYKCKRPAIADRITEDTRFVEFKKYIEAFADTFGYASKVTSVPGGRKAELTPQTDLGQKNMGSALKVTLEVRTIGKDLLGIYTAEFPANVWAGYLLQQDSIPEMRIRKRIEDLVGVEPGGCELQ